MPGGKQGLVEAAEQGTLFLDEIGDMPLSLQIKLLELVQDKLYKRVGDSAYRKANIRIIAATNQNLAKLVQENRFRRDLYYRLNVFPIQIAPLRERTGDVRLLLHHFTILLNSKTGKDVMFSEEAIRELEAYSWPGNVRELKNIIERLVIMTSDSVIRSEDIPPFIKPTVQDILEEEILSLDSFRPARVQRITVRRTEGRPGRRTVRTSRIPSFPQAGQRARSRRGSRRRTSWSSGLVLVRRSRSRELGLDKLAAKGAATGGRRPRSSTRHRNRPWPCATNRR